MSMFDPRMKHLVDNEGLRGLGAYWIIIEKLSILPEPRAQLDYLRAYCDSKKITLCSLRKSSWNTTFLNWKKTDTLCPKS